MAKISNALIIDDDENFRKYLKNIIEKYFPAFAVNEAADAKESQKIIHDLKPEIIFVDIRLPGKNGITLTREIKASNSNIIVIIITGYNIPEYRLEARRLGVDAFIAKDSADTGKIVAEIKKCLSKIDSGQAK